MNHLNRRDFIKQAGVAGLATAVPGWAPLVLTPRRTTPRTEQGTVVFKPYYVQRGVGPHMDATYGYASDTKWDAFHSDIHVAPAAGLVVSDTEGQDRFGVTVQWNAEDFGYLFITADNGGEFYSLPASGQTKTYNLNYEFAKSRVMRNRRRMAKHAGGGFAPSRQLNALIDVSEGYYEDATRASDEEKRAVLAQKSLVNAMWASEAMEVEKARQDILNQGARDFFFGCDARALTQIDPDVVMACFNDLFNYATITHYLESGYQDFEPTQGHVKFNFRDAMLDELRDAGITVEGRPIFWPHKVVTPDWLRALKYDDLLRYVEQHTRKVVGHYGDKMYAWEIVNEFHDWANENNLSPEQTVEVTKLACDVAKDTAPNVQRLINNCCPFGGYVQQGENSGGKAIYPQRTPWEFMKDLTDAGVDYTISGVQMYFPYRDLQDTIIHIERFEQFGRPVQLTEVGASSGPSRRSVVLETLPISEEPYVWHRGWDFELQADWVEGLYTMAYSKPWIEASNWYDLDDDHAWIENGGLITSPDGKRKPAFHRLKKLQDEWRSLG